MQRILNYGSLNIDHVYKLDHIVLPGETLGSECLSFFAGGKGANQSVAIAKAGAEVYHAGKIGNDGKWLLDTLSAAGVHTELVSVFDGHTGHAVIQVNKDGENSIILYGGGNKEIRTPEIDRALSGFESGDYIVLQNEINEIPYIIEKAHDRGLRIYLNPAPFSQEVKTWPLKLIDTLVVNETEASGLAGLQGPEEEILDTLTDMYPDTDIVLTAGKRGAYFGRGQRRQRGRERSQDREREYVPIVESQVVDTTAAGDTFLGYYLVSRIEGLSPLDSMKRATMASSITVSRPGAMESIPLASELPEDST